MMTTQADINEIFAQLILKDVTLFFKGDLKSSNKFYDENVCLDEKTISALECKSKEEALQKFSDRNKNKEIVKVELSKYREFFDYDTKDDAYAYGAEIILQPEKNRKGNCLEMASLAAFHAANKKSLNDLVWVGHITKPGDHVFCLVGKAEQPSWKSVSEMVKAAADDWWVIDPWADICCQAKQYDSKFEEQMSIWSGQGKRILMYGVEYNPSEEKYMFGFRNGDLRIKKVVNTLVKAKKVTDEESDNLKE
jgi:hypothetical protein